MLRVSNLTTAVASLAVAAGLCLNADAEPRRFFFRAFQDNQAEPLPAPELPTPNEVERPRVRAFAPPSQKGLLQIQKGYSAKVPSAAPIRYVQHHPHRRTCCDCTTQIKTVLQVTDPRSGCRVSVPVCLPGCCTELAAVKGHRGLFGRAAVGYRWCCGYRVKVVFDRHGSVTVHYFGR